MANIAPNQSRMMPHSIDAEQAVLGSMLISDEAVSSVMTMLRPMDFYREDHRLIFESIERLRHKNSPIDLVTVINDLESSSLLEKAGGYELITQLSNLVPTSANASHYAQIVRDKADIRNLIRAATEIAGMAYSEEYESDVMLDKAEQLIMSASNRRSVTDVPHINELVLQTVQNLEKMASSPGELFGLPTGYVDLDKHLLGMQPADLVLVAARPSMGKTAFTLNIATNLAVLRNKPVAFFSLEMSASQLMTRIVSSAALINAHDMRAGKMTEDDWSRLVSAADRLYDKPLYIDDTPGISVMELRAKARRIKARHGLELIIIDYLQLMQGASGSEGRQQEVSDISRALKALARELSVPIITLSQLNRGVESRQDKRPLLSDLRESGALEQDADIVMFLYREDYYMPDSTRPNVTDIIIAKHRNGPTGNVPLLFRKEYTRFESLSPR